MKSLTTHFDTARRIARIVWRDGVLRRKPTRIYHEHHTFNEWHLGDNLIHLNFLRRLAARSPHEKFVHACRECYLGQLRPVVADLPNVRLVALKDMHPGSINCWKNYGKWTGRGGYFDRSDKQADFVAFHLMFFNDLARRMGTTSPIGCASDFLFNYPAVLKSLSTHEGRYDVLVCNSTPQSNQLLGWKDGDWDDVIEYILQRGRSVICTQQSPFANSQTGADCTYGLDVTGVGNVSLRCGLIVGCPCGPMWPTWNVRNRDTPRIVVHGKETINIGSRTQHARNKAELLSLLEAHFK